MTSENETVESVIANARKELDYGEGVLLHLTGKRANEIFDCIEAAHQREVAELRECLKETMVDAVAEYKNNSCFRNVKCGEIERCDTCKVMRWRKALKGTSND